jgi:minor extracellular protease Epr
MKKTIIIIILIIATFITKAAYVASIKIGVIDTGIKEKEGIFDSERILDGKNYVLDDGSTDDEVGHGTRIASLIIGTLDGVIVSPCIESGIIPLVYYTKFASGVVINGGVEAICDAIYDAVDIYDCRVINISSGIKADDERLEAAVKYAEEKDVLIVSACGNSGENVYYPAAYDTVIGVGSHNDRYEPSDFSCEGRGLDILVQGENLKVVSIKNAQDYELVSGTSYSAALVTSYAASALEKYPQLTPSQIRYIMKVSCDDICDEGYDEKSGYGIFNPKLFYENLVLFDGGEMVCFFDVKKDDWYYDGVKTAYQEGLIIGNGEGIFDPCGNMTRGMFITIIYRLEDEPQTNDLLSFDDVEEDAYYADAARWAESNGIIKGYSDKKFAPEKNITREEMAAMLIRYSEYKGKEIDTDTIGDLAIFADEDAVSSWAIENIKWAVGTGLLRPDDENVLDPTGCITRAEASVILQRFLSLSS